MKLPQKKPSAKVAVTRLNLSLQFHVWMFILVRSTGLLSKHSCVIHAAHIGLFRPFLAKKYASWFFHVVTVV